MIAVQAYMDDIGLTQTAKDRVGDVIPYMLSFGGGTVEEIFIVDRRAPDGGREFLNLWVYT